jgi:hypothetical protein
MDILYKNGLSYDNLRLSKNEIELNVKPINPTITDRSKMRYFLEVYIPTVKNSTTLKLLPVLDAPEEPFTQVGDVYIASGAFFLVNELLHSYLSVAAPLISENKIMPVENHVMPFKVKRISKNNGVVVETIESGFEYVIRGGIKEEHLREWEGQLFSNYVGPNRKFLTWNPTKVVLPEQPNYLYFLTNMKPTPTVLTLRLYRYYADGTEDTKSLSVMAIADVQYMTTYSVPIGAKQLGITDLSKKVVKYVVWLNNQDGEIVSEQRTYIIDWQYYREKKYILFRNSLGGYDSLGLTGDFAANINLIRDESERYKPYQSLASFSEVEVSKVTGQKEIKVNTGWLTKQERDWLEELALSEDILLVSDRDYIPLVLQDSNYVSEDSVERLIGRSFTLRYANNQRNFSSLPISAKLADRPTGWRSYSSGACQIDSFGKRTGKQFITLIEKYYIDDNSSVQPFVIRNNTPGKEGYIAPTTSAGCVSTPFVNAAYSLAGTYRKNDCANGQYGSFATIAIPSGRWGSEISQADANAKALAEWNAINTQSYANINGTCAVLLAGISAKIWPFYLNIIPQNLDSMGNPTNTRIDTTGNLSSVAFPFENTFAVRWDGFLKAPISGLVNFKVTQDDGVRIWIDDVLKVDNWFDTGFLETNITMTLELNKFYKIRVDYFQNYGGIECGLKWSYSGQSEIYIPSTNLFREP